MAKISKFDGKYKFLSNFYRCPISYRGMVFSSAESAFQSQKSANWVRMMKFQELNPYEAKKLGGRIRIRPDWDDIRDFVMYEVVKAKFSQNFELREKLLATGVDYLEEGNIWGDKYWGRCNGIGKNKLGHILMRVREELRYPVVPKNPTYVHPYKYKGVKYKNDQIRARVRVEQYCLDCIRFSGQDHDFSQCVLADEYNDDGELVRAKNCPYQHVAVPNSIDICQGMIKCKIKGQK